MLQIQNIMDTNISMVYKIFDKTFSGDAFTHPDKCAVKSEIMSNHHRSILTMQQLHKPIIKI